MFYAVLGKISLTGWWLVLWNRNVQINAYVSLSNIASINCATYLGYSSKAEVSPYLMSRRLEFPWEIVMNIHVFSLV